MVIRGKKVERVGIPKLEVKVFPYRLVKGSIVYFGEVWMHVGSHRNIVVEHFPTLYRKPSSVERELKRWVKTKACKQITQTLLRTL
jgi:hypothetical protein